MSGSGKTSGTAPPPPSTPPDKLTEKEYLAQQAASARLALSRAWGEAKSHLGQGVNPVAWAREFPWVTVGAAAVAGFTAAATLVPSREQQALRRLARIERALNPPPPKPEQSNGDWKKEPGGVLGTILHEVLAVVRPALVGLITAGMGAYQSPPSDGQAKMAAGSEDEAQQSYGGA